MTELYKITPSTEWSIKSVMILKENFSNIGNMPGSERSMSIITVYKTGHAYLPVNNELYLEDLNSPIICQLDLGIPVLTEAHTDQEFEFGNGLNGIFADDLRDNFKNKWIDGIDGLKGLELFTSNNLGSPSWFTSTTHIRISGPITIDKVNGIQYNNIIQANIQPVSKYDNEIIEPTKSFGLNFKLRSD